jgi:hypothetical protein
MPSEILSEVRDLRERVERLENDRARTKRGHVNQRRAAEYLGKSREWLRQRERSGDGPRRNSDNTYSLDELDRFKEAGAGQARPVGRAFTNEASSRPRVMWRTTAREGAPHHFNHPGAGRPRP